MKMCSIAMVCGLYCVKCASVCDDDNDDDVCVWCVLRVSVINLDHKKHA